MCNRIVCSWVAQIKFHQATLCPLIVPFQEGLETEQITELVENLSATEPEHVETRHVPSLPDPMPGHTLKLHVPPRASNKITQTIRHAAAKAVAQLGLEKAGLVRVSGWMALQLDWQGLYTPAPEEIKKMPDYDAGEGGQGLC